MLLSDAEGIVDTCSGTVVMPVASAGVDLLICFRRSSIAFISRIFSGVILDFELLTESVESGRDLELPLEPGRGGYKESSETTDDLGREGSDVEGGFVGGGLGSFA